MILARFRSVRLTSRERHFVFSPGARAFQFVVRQSSVQMEVSCVPSFGRVHAPGKGKLSIFEGAGDRLLCVGKPRLHLFSVLREGEGAAPFTARRLPDESPPTGQIGAEEAGGGGE